MCVPVTWVTSGREGGPKRGCLPPVCMCVPVTWVTSGREGGPSAVARSNPRPRLRLIDAGALTPPPLPTHGPPRGQGGKFERGGGLVGQHSQSGFDYFRQANGLCWLLGLWLRSNKKYLGVSDFGTRECLYLVTTGR